MPIVVMGMWNPPHEDAGERVPWGRGAGTRVFAEDCAKPGVCKLTSSPADWPNSKWKSDCQKLVICSRSWPPDNNSPCVHEVSSGGAWNSVMVSWDPTRCELKYLAISCSVSYTSYHEVWMWTLMLQQLLSWKLLNMPLVVSGQQSDDELLCCKAAMSLSFWSCPQGLQMPDFKATTSS